MNEHIEERCMSLRDEALQQSCSESGARKDAREAKKVKSIRTIANRTLGYCPSCGRGLDSYHDGNSGEHITHYCYNCGQAVKWE